MPTRIGPKSVNLYGGIAILIVSIAGLLASIYLLLFCLLAVHLNYKGAIGAGLLLVSTFFLFIKFAPLIFSEPFWVIIDDNLKTLELKYLFKKPRLIRRDHVISYQDAAAELTVRNSTTQYSGIDIGMLDGTKIIISEKSLDDISYIKTMLDYWGINKSEGEELIEG